MCAQRRSADVFMLRDTEFAHALRVIVTTAQMAEVMQKRRADHIDTVTLRGRKVGCLRRVVQLIDLFTEVIVAAETRIKRHDLCHGCVDALRRAVWVNCVRGQCVCFDRYGALTSGVWV